jgi:hypothetical protein
LFVTVINFATLAAAAAVVVVVGGGGTVAVACHFQSILVLKLTTF